MLFPPLKKDDLLFFTRFFLFLGLLSVSGILIHGGSGCGCYFCFCSAKKWKLWKQAWLNFTIVSKISTQDDSYQKALFLCTIGQITLEIYNAFRYSTSGHPDKVDTIIAKFDEYFMGDVNETYESFKFNQKNQEAGESFDAYFTASLAFETW